MYPPKGFETKSEIKEVLSFRGLKKDYFYDFFFTETMQVIGFETLYT